MRTFKYFALSSFVDTHNAFCKRCTDVQHDRLQYKSCSYNLGERDGDALYRVALTRVVGSHIPRTPSNVNTEWRSVLLSISQGACLPQFNTEFRTMEWLSCPWRELMGICVDELIGRCTLLQSLVFITAGRASKGPKGESVFLLFVHLLSCSWIPTMNLRKIGCNRRWCSQWFRSPGVHCVGRSIGPRKCEKES